VRNGVEYWLKTIEKIKPIKVKIVKMKKVKLQKWAISSQAPKSKMTWRRFRD